MNKRTHLLTFVLALTGSAAYASSPVASPPAAQHAAATPVSGAVQPSTALTQRAADVVKMINGQMEPAQLFSPRALAKIPAERIVRVAAMVRAKHGAALGVDQIEAETPSMGTAHIVFENARFPVKLTVEDTEPHLLIGMQL